MNVEMCLLVCDERSPYTGRIYPVEEVQKMIDHFNRDASQTNINNKYGTFGSDAGLYEGVPFDKISHIVSSLSLDGNKVMARIKILDTPAGNTVKRLIDGLRLSPAMVGAVNPDTDDATTVISDLILIRTEFVLKDNNGEE